MRATSHLYLLIALLVFLGCGKTKDAGPGAANGLSGKQARQQQVNSAFQLDVESERLRLPKGMSKFWRDYNTERVPIDKVEEVLRKARSYEELDQHKAFYYSIIPIVKVKAAWALCDAGKTAEALELLQEVRTKGYVPVDLLSNSSFDSIREDVRFTEIEKFAKEESDSDAVGPYLRVEKPFCALADLLSLETTPPSPDPGSYSDSPVVVFTGPELGRGLGGADSELLKSLAEKGFKVIAIVAKPPKGSIDGVDFLVANIKDPKAMLIDGTRMCWIADRSGNVSYNLRMDAYYAPDEPALVAEYFKTH